MITLRTASILTLLLALVGFGTTGQAQDARQTKKTVPATADSAAVAVAGGVAVDSAAAGEDSVDSLPKKRGGFMGKVKGLARNKVVRTVAKVAACTVVPGGQFVAGAIDAAGSEGAAGVAQGVAGGATGSSCMPGMGGAAGMAGGVPGAGVGGAGMSPTAGMPMGLSAEQMAAMQAGGAGGGAGGAAMAAQMQQMMAGIAPGMAPAGGPQMTEAPGQSIELAGDLAAELAKGKTVIRNIDWVGGAATVSAAGTAQFGDAVTKLAAAMRQVGGSYRVNLYLDQRYEDAIVKTLGADRLSVIERAIADAPGGGEVEAVETGKIKRDKHPRLEVVRR